MSADGDPRKSAPASPYARLRAAVDEYGEAAMQNFLRCRALGQAILEELPGWLNCDPGCVSAVPAQGPFDPERDYREEAFSYSADPVIRLEPVVFGVCVTVPHREDSGKLWLRTGVRVEMTGDTFDVYVADQPMVRVPLQFDGHLTPVHELIHAELMGLFGDGLARFRDERYRGGIGFMPTP